MKRLQEFELDTYCKNKQTALNRFQKKFPKCFEIWGEVIEYMLDHGETKWGSPEEGWVLNVDTDGFDWFYMDVIIYHECQLVA